MDDIATATPLRWRPAPAWLPAGLILGAPCGGVVGAVLLSSIGIFGDGPDLDFGRALLGGTYGALFGGIVGLMVGFVMTFLGGSHLSGRQARQRAFLVASVSTGLILAILLGSVFAFHPVALVTAFISALGAGGLSYWLASLGMRSTNDA